MTTKDYSTGSLIIRLNALRQPLTIRGMMVWQDIFRSDNCFCDVQYMTGCWFINGCKVKASEVDDFIAKAEAMYE